MSYGKFGIQKVFTFWFVVYNLNHHQIGENLRKVYENYLIFCSNMFKFVAKLNHQAFNGQVCWKTWPWNARWLSLATNLTFFNQKIRNFGHFPQISLNFIHIDVVLDCEPLIKYFCTFCLPNLPYEINLLFVSVQI